MRNTEAPGWAHEKWPRQYAAEICAMESAADRAKALEDVPEKYREWVAELVAIALDRRARKRET